MIIIGELKISCFPNYIVPDSQHLFNIQMYGKFEGCQGSQPCIRILRVI